MLSTGARFIITLCTILGGVAIIMGGVIWCLKALWNIRGSWDATNARLERLVDRVQDLVSDSKERTERLERRDDRLEERMERHEQWHAGH